MVFLFSGGVIVYIISLCFWSFLIKWKNKCLGVVSRISKMTSSSLRCSDLILQTCKYDDVSHLWFCVLLYGTVALKIGRWSKWAWHNHVKAKGKVREIWSMRTGHTVAAVKMEGSVWKAGGGMRVAMGQTATSGQQAARKWGPSCSNQSGESKFSQQSEWVQILPQSLQIWASPWLCPVGS